MLSYTSGDLVQDIDFDGGWFPFRETLDALGEIAINNNFSFDDIGELLKKYIRTAEIPTRLKYYTFDGVETIYNELVNPNIREV